MVWHGKLWHVTHGKQARHSVELSGEVKLLTQQTVMGDTEVADENSLNLG